MEVSVSKEREPASGAPQGARRATGGAPEEQRDGRGRWSAKRKAAAILRLLRGEDLETLSRELGVTAATLSGWRDPCLDGGEANTECSDETVTGKIREVLAASPFYGEGPRKVWARLRMAGVRTSKARVLRLMREAQLLAPTRTIQGAENPHTGTIITERPNKVWASDHTATATVEDGQVTVFVAVDHCTTECVGLHAAQKATRFEALEPLRHGVRDYCGGFRAGAAAGIRNRHDHGSQYLSDDYQAEIAFLGMQSSPSFVRQPQCNGCVERFIRTLKEQFLWVRTFQNVEELRHGLAEFRERYNQRWIVQRLGYLTPAQARQQLLALGAAA